MTSRGLLLTLTEPPPAMEEEFNAWYDTEHLPERLSIPGVQSLISSAEAIVGRPLTPVSVAGVARRTVRRCAVGVYNC